MIDVTFSQLVDIEQIRHLLEAQYKITGILSAILDTDENILVAVGWQDICTRFHRAHPGACERCRESDAYIKEHLHDFNGGYLDYRCKNGLRDVAVPIIIDGKHLATFFTGQFFYVDDRPDMEFFRAQAREFDFDEESYLEAVERVPVTTRDQIRTIMDYYHNLVQIMMESGLKNLELTREVKERIRAEKKLQESRDYLDKIINSIPDPIFVKDRGHRLLLVNDAECALAGRSREEIIGKTDYDFFPKEQVDVFWEKDELVFETEQENSNEEDITDAHGEKRIVITKKTLCRDMSGNSFLVGIIRDFTDLKRAEAEILKLNAELEQRVSERTAQLTAANEELQREIAERKKVIAELQLTQSCVDKASIGIYRISEEGKILYANECASLSLGYTPEELCAMTVFDIDPTFTLERFREHRRKLYLEGRGTFETEHRRKDGSTFPVEITVNFLEHQGKKFSTSFVKDITERKLFEEQLKKRKRQLEELNSTLEKRVLKEVAKNREKDIILIQQNRQAALGETLEHIAHQWKQPLNAIAIFVQLLGENYACGLLTDECMRETVDKIIALLGHMAQTIDVFRDFYKPEKEQKAFRLKDSIDKALTFILPALKFQNIAVELDVDSELSAIGHPNEYAQVLINILTNARDACKERAVESPRVVIRGFAKGHKAVLTITDNAGGIPEEIIGNIFDLYFTTKGASGGTGIGLYMSKNIIEMNMGGKLSAGNIVSGAQFRIEINMPG